MWAQNSSSAMGCSKYVPKGLCWGELDRLRPGLLAPGGWLPLWVEETAKR
jgi:hypothetical protein